MERIPFSGRKTRQKNLLILIASFVPLPVMRPVRENTGKSQQ
jgi:hypothetical protein